MTMGEYIKYLRKENQMSQEELGKRLDPPVNKSAVNKWENGQVENIKRCHIEQMSKIFDVKPSELMCFEDTSVELLKQVKDNFGQDAARLLSYYLKLNKIGRDKIISYSEDLDKYQM